MKPLRKIREISAAITLLNQAFLEEWYFRRMVRRFATPENYGKEFLDTLGRYADTPVELEDELFECSESDDELVTTYQKMRQLFDSAKHNIFEELYCDDSLRNSWVEKYGEENAKWAIVDVDTFDEYVARIRTTLWRIGREYGLIVMEDVTQSQPQTPIPTIYPDYVIKHFVTKESFGKPENERLEIAQRNCADFFTVDGDMSVRGWVMRTVDFVKKDKLNLGYGTIKDLQNQLGDEIVKYDNYQKQISEELKRRAQ